MKERGFTLIELLVVVAILGLLASVVLANLNNARIKSRDTARKAALSQLSKALENYFSQNNSYPSTGGAWRSSEPGDVYNPDPTNYIPGLATSYVSRLPRDPRGGTTVIATCGATAIQAFLYNSNGTDYKLISHCAPEGSVLSNDPFYDPTRPTWAWQVSSTGGRSW